MFRDIKIEKNKFYRKKVSVPLRDVDIEKVLLSNKIYFVEQNCKYFNGYLYNNDKVKPSIIVRIHYSHHKSPLILKKNLIARLSPIKNF